MATYPWENLRPNDTLQLVLKEWISDRDWGQLLNLYLPIIGSDAYALFHALYQRIGLETFQSEVLRHSDLMNLLVWNKETYVRARMRLEALGLLRVYTRKEQFQDPQALLFLYAPVTAATFFNDPTLSSLLYGAVGEARYQALAAKDEIALLKTFKAAEWQETTTQFKDAYRLPMQHPQAAMNAATHVTKATEPHLPLAPPDFDRELFTEYLQQSFLGERAVTAEVVAMSASLSQLYGMDEVDLARLAYQAADVRTNTIDVKRYQQLALEAALAPASEQTTAPLVERVSAKQAADAQAADKNAAHWRAAGLTPEQLTLAKEAKQYAVIPFAKYLKAHRHGFLTPSEGKTLKSMVERGHLKPAVINIMTYYYLVEMERENLAASTLQRTEDDWAQKQIDTPEAALVYLKARQENQDKARAQRKKTYQKPKPGYQEAKPKWLIEQQKQKAQGQKQKADSAQTQTSVASANTELINERLNQLLNKGGE